MTWPSTTTEEIHPPGRKSSNGGSISLPYARIKKRASNRSKKPKEMTSEDNGKIVLIKEVESKSDRLIACNNRVINSKTRQIKRIEQILEENFD